MTSIIQSLWIGEALGTLEKLSIASFLKNGHEYHLYTYGPIRNLPEGVILKDAEAIISSKKIFRYGEPAGKGKGSYSGFSNFFRYKLLLDRGGYWVDGDVVCLKPFDFQEEYVLASELWPEHNMSKVSSCLLKAPKGCELLQLCWDFCLTRDPTQLQWAETGPSLLTKAVNTCSLTSLVKPYDLFCPITFLEVEKLIAPDVQEYLGNAYAVHFWNEEWRRRGYDKEKRYDPSSLYEQFKAYYLSE